MEVGGRMQEEHTQHHLYCGAELIDLGVFHSHTQEVGSSFSLETY